MRKEQTKTFLFCIMENISEKKIIPVHTQNQQTICEKSKDAKKKKKQKNILNISIISSLHHSFVLI